MELNYQTPIEEYNNVWVKRDDLLNGDNSQLPPWGKIEPVRRILLDCKKDVPISCLSVRGSYTGWCLSVLGKMYDLDIKVSFPNSKNYPKKDLDRIESNGAELVPIKPNMTSIVFNKHKSISKEKGWQQFPYGFDSPLYHDYFEERVKSINDKFDNLVVSAGSGVSSIGLIKGFCNDNKKKVYIITVSSISTIEKILKKHEIETENVIIHQADYKFYDEMESYSTPFPCNSLWDKKAYNWIQMNPLPGKTLFWNLGG